MNKTDDDQVLSRKHNTQFGDLAPVIFWVFFFFTPEVASCRQAPWHQSGQSHPSHFRNIGTGVIGVASAISKGLNLERDQFVTLS